MLSKSKQPCEVNFQKKLHHIAKEFRKTSTTAEIVLWKAIRESSEIKVRFRRQYPLYQYIADFYCHNAKLIIEVDGPIHLHQKDRDSSRDMVLKKYGYTTLRFTNEQVLFKTDQIIQAIEKYLHEHSL